MRKAIIFFLLFVLIISMKNNLHALEFNDVDIHGFISQGYLKTNKNNYLAKTEEGTFQFNEMGINFSTNLTDTLHIGMQFFARDLGDVSNDDVILDWAFADYRWRNWLGLRIGKIKIDYGLYNEAREMDMLRTSVMLPQSVYPELWRNSLSTVKGFAFYGYVPLSSMGKLAYDVQIGAMEFKQDTGFIGSFGPQINPFLSISEVDSDYTWFCNLKWNTFLPGLKIKYTYYDIKGQKAQGNYVQIIRDPNVQISDPRSDPNVQMYTMPVNVEFNKRDGNVFSLEYTWENLAIVAEYAQENYPSTMMPMPPMIGWTSPEQGSTSTGGTLFQNEWIPHEPPRTKSEGWYIASSYRFTDWFELGLSYSEYYPNANDKHGLQLQRINYPKFMAWLKTTTLSTRFDINEYWVLKLESSYNDGFGGINVPFTPLPYYPLDVNNYVDQYWYLFAAKATFSF